MRQLSADRPLPPLPAAPPSEHDEPPRWFTRLCWAVAIVVGLCFAFAVSGFFAYVGAQLWGMAT